MGMLQTEIKTALQAVEGGLMYIKIVKSDRSDMSQIFDFLFSQYAGYDTLDIVLELVAGFLQ